MDNTAASGTESCCPGWKRGLRHSRRKIRAENHGQGLEAPSSSQEDSTASGRNRKWLGPNMARLGRYVTKKLSREQSSAISTVIKWHHVMLCFVTCAENATVSTNPSTYPNPSTHPFINCMYSKVQKPTQDYHPHARSHPFLTSTHPFIHSETTHLHSCAKHRF